MSRPAGRSLRRLTAATAVVTYLLIVAGGVVRVTGNGLGCGQSGQDWPLCHGGLVPPPDLGTLIEFNHRIFATASTVLLIATLVVAWTRYRDQRRIIVAATAAMALLVIQILLGALTVETRLLSQAILVHLANAELTLAVLVYLAYVAFTMGTPREMRPLAPQRLCRLGFAAAAAVYILVLSGALVVDRGAGGGCSAWPLCGRGFDLPATEVASVNVAHRVVAGAVVLLVGFIMGVVLRRSADPGIRRGAMLVNVLLLAQVVVGAVMVDTGLQTFVRGTHIALASGLWATTVLVALLLPRADLRPSHSGRRGEAPAQRAEATPA